jgi:hypothetical protein
MAPIPGRAPPTAADRPTNHIAGRLATDRLAPLPASVRLCRDRLRLLLRNFDFRKFRQSRQELLLDGPGQRCLQADQVVADRHRRQTDFAAGPLPFAQAADESTDSPFGDGPEPVGADDSLEDVQDGVVLLACPFAEAGQVLVLEQLAELVPGQFAGLLVAAVIEIGLEVNSLPLGFPGVRSAGAAAFAAACFGVDPLQSQQRPVFAALHPDCNPFVYHVLSSSGPTIIATRPGPGRAQ